MSGRSVKVLSHLPLPLLERVADEVPDVELVFVESEGEPPGDVRGEVLLTQTWAAPNIAAVMARGVEWVHAYGTGVNRFPFDVLEGRPLTCSRGASAVPISEWVLAVMLAFEKRLPESWIDAPPDRWNMADLGGLAGRHLGLVGFGGIGQAVATRALAFDVRVRALRRTAAASPVAGVEIVEKLDALIGWADHLVVAAPATRRTRHMLDAEAFAAAKPGLHLVNVARGEIVDQDALRAALDSGRLAMASLDTVTPEPLPQGHWLYTHPQVRLSPHVSWSMPGSYGGLIDPFVRNLRHWQAGEPLEDRVDPEEGY
jgi:phosphoglycerate dehydrogenase-like enzyme